MTKYMIVWDNGAGDSGTLPESFPTYENAEEYGNSWFHDFCLDNGLDPEDADSAGFDVVEVTS